MLFRSRFVTNNWKIIVISLIIFIVLAYFSFLLLKYNIVNHKLKSVRKEEEILMGLIKEMQRDCFERNKLTMNEYYDSLLQYEKRMSKVIQEIIALETTKINLFKLFKTEYRRLIEERSKLLSLIKKTQELYLKSGNIETRVY